MDDNNNTVFSFLFLLLFIFSTASSSTIVNFHQPWVFSFALLFLFVMFLNEIWLLFTFIWLLKLWLIEVTWDSLSRFVSLEIVFWTDNSVFLDVERWICMLTKTFKPKYELVLHLEQWCLWVVWPSFLFSFYVIITCMVATVWA